MSDLMLHGVLNMPPELWDNSEIDKMQRYSRYMEASRKIEQLQKDKAELVEAYDKLYKYAFVDNGLSGKDCFGIDKTLNYIGEDK